MDFLIFYSHIPGHRFEKNASPFSGILTYKFLDHINIPDAAAPVYEIENIIK
jgi:hypothetical protein